MICATNRSWRGRTIWPLLRLGNKSLYRSLFGCAAFAFAQHMVKHRVNYCIASIATRPEDHRMRPALLALSIALATTALAQTPLPSHGPAKGYLVITGGAPDYKNFLALAGGKDAHIVVIPTAAITRPEDERRLPPYCSAPGPFAGLKCTVLHTTDRKVADSPAFAPPPALPPSCPTRPIHRTSRSNSPMTGRGEHRTECEGGFRSPGPGHLRAW
jgi:hypothetical protein